MDCKNPQARNRLPLRAIDWNIMTKIHLRTNKAVLFATPDGVTIRSRQEAESYLVRVFTASIFFTSKKSRLSPLGRKRREWNHPTYRRFLNPWISRLDLPIKSWNLQWFLQIVARSTVARTSGADHLYPGSTKSTNRKSKPTSHSRRVRKEKSMEGVQPKIVLRLPILRWLLHLNMSKLSSHAEWRSEK